MHVIVIVKSKCCVGFFCVLPVINLAPFDGGSGGPPVVECVCNGACGGCPFPPTMLNRGMPPAAGGCAGGGGPCPPPGGAGGGCPCPPPDGGGGLGKCAFGARQVETLVFVRGFRLCHSLRRR